MIQNPSKLEQFHHEFLSKENIPYPRALKFFESLYQEAKALGVFNDHNILEGLEVNLRLARGIHQLRS